MRNLGTILTPVIILLLFVFTQPSAADIVSVKIRSQYRDTIHLSKFEFSHTSFASLAISSFAFSSLPVNSNLSPPDPSRVGFYLVSDELLEHFDLTSCPLDSKFISVLLTFQDLSPPAYSSFNKTFPMKYPGLYSLYFTNCNEFSSVTMDDRAELYNIDHNNVKDYLSAGLNQLPKLYLSFSIIYLCFVVIWILVCFKNPRYFNGTYLLMVVLFVMTAVHYGCAAVVQQHVKVTGTRPHGWNVLFYIFQFISNVLFFTVIGTAGGMIRLLFFFSELFVFILIVVVQVYANIGSMLVWDAGPNCEIWWYAVDLTCCSFSISAIALSYDSFKLSLAGEMKLRSPFMFLLVAVVYTIFTACIVLAPPDRWVFNVGKETGALVYCMVMFYMFRP